MRQIVLKCLSCGGNLEIKPNMTNFACGYCGTQQVVHREGGVVALEVVADAIAGVKASTDRVAAELKARRLKDEKTEIEVVINATKKECEEAEKAGKDQAEKVRFTIIMIGFVLAVWIMTNASYACLLVLFVPIAGFALWRLYKIIANNGILARVRELRQKRDDLVRRKEALEQEITQLLRG